MRPDEQSPPRPPWLAGVILLFLGSTCLGMDLALPGIIMPALRSTFRFGVFIAGLVGSAGFVVDGFAAYFVGGNAADRLQDRKKVLLPSALAFSALSWITAVVSFTWLLVAVRAVIGFATGGWYANAYTKATEDPPVRWRAAASGLHMASYSVGAGLLGPAIAPTIVDSVGWRGCFLILTAPMILIVLAGYKVFRPGVNKANIETDDEPAAMAAGRSRSRLLEIFSYRNVVLAFFIQAFMFATVTLFTVFAPLYLTGQRFSLVAAGGIITGWGIGGIAGNIALPVVSDYLGRRPTGAAALFIGCVAVLLFLRLHSFAALFGCTMAIGFFVQGSSSIFLGLVPQESLPARIRGTGTSFVHAGTVTIGGGLMALAAGAVGQFAGVAGSIYTGIGFCLLGCVLSLFVRETAPRRMRASVAPHTVAEVR
jgi:predicted MFS family arabinose efflux permease